MKRILSFVVLSTVLLVTTRANAYQFLYTCGPHWSNLPITYYLNNAGSADMSLNTLQQVIASSYAAWEEPCCSKFRAQFGGMTASTAPANNNKLVLSWEEHNWDPQFGSANVTIGVTLTSVWNDCTLADGPILFNGVGFTFSSNGSQTDMQSIATHEIGHQLGLDHSSISQSTMFASYSGGTAPRSLHQDDIDGVCALYNKACTCITSNDCVAGDICSTGVCREAPCTSTSQCQAGLECQISTGKCIVPPCSADVDCETGFYCASDATCKSRCPICSPCTSNSDCGQNGVCSNLGKCISFCQQGGLCPGDSECFSYNGNNICLNGNASTAGICPDGYVCTDNTPNFECTTNSQCSANEICQANTCVTRPDPCADVTCLGNQTCSNGNCVSSTSTNTTTNSNNGTNQTVGATDAHDIDQTNGNPTTNNTDINNSLSDPATQTNSPGVIILLDQEDTRDGCSSTDTGINGIWPLVLALGLVRRHR